MSTPISSRPTVRPVPPTDTRGESAPVARNEAVPERGPVDVFAPDGVTDAGARSADKLKRYEELDAVQQGLLGPKGAELYAGLSSKQRGVFLLLTQRLEANGVDLSGLRLKGGAEGIRGNNLRFDLLFEPDSEALAHFKESVKGAVQAGKLSEDQPSSVFHGGMSEWGVRENRSKYALQIGFGPDGAFVDMDRYNPKKGGFWNHVKHWGEILTPGNMDPFKVAQELKEDIWSKQPPA